MALSHGGGAAVAQPLPPTQSVDVVDVHGVIVN